MFPKKTRNGQFFLIKEAVAGEVGGNAYSSGQVAPKLGAIAGIIVRSTALTHSALQRKSASP